MSLEDCVQGIFGVALRVVSGMIVVAVLKDN